MKYSQVGYAGIIMLIIVALLIGFIMVRPDIITGKKETKSTLENSFNAIDKARDAKKQIEVKSQIPEDLLNN